MTQVINIVPLLDHKRTFDRYILKLQDLDTLIDENGYRMSLLEQTHLSLVIEALAKEIMVQDAAGIEAFEEVYKELSDRIGGFVKRKEVELK